MRIWGCIRVLEMLQKFSEGFFVNGFWSAVIVTAVTIGFGLFLHRVLAHMLKRIGEKSGDTIRMTFLSNVLKGIIAALCVMIILMQVKPLESVARSLLAGSGILVVAISFASQEAVSNIVGGMFLTLYRPFNIGDRITIPEQNITGFVEDITLRHTVLRTVQNSRVVIPNSTMNNAVLENSNLSEDKVLNVLEVPVSYTADLDRAMQIIREEAEAHREFLDNRSDEEKQSGAPAVPVRVVSFGDSSIDLKAWIWSKDPGSGFVLLCDLRYQIKKRFDREGIEIPYPYRTVVLKKDSMQD